MLPKKGRRKRLERIVIVVTRQRQLFQMVAALHPSRRFASCLDGRQQQGNQDANDRNDHEQFNEGETSGALMMSHGIESKCYENEWCGVPLAMPVPLISN